MNRLFVLDTNLLISAFLFEGSVPHRAYRKAAYTGKLASSNETFAELQTVFLRPKFDKYLSLEKRLATLAEFKDIPRFFTPSEAITDCRDPKDNKFLELAVAAGATCIVSGDEDLLVLNPFRGIPILNAADFLNRF